MFAGLVRVVCAAKQVASRLRFQASSKPVPMLKATHTAKNRYVLATVKNAHTAMDTTS